MHATRLCLAGLLGCAGCTAAQAPPDAGPAADCRTYSTQVVIDNEAQPLTGTACRQSDGSWRIAETVPGQPATVVVVYPPAGAVYAPDQAWLWGMPVGLDFGLNAFVFVDHDHRFHAFRHFHDFDHDHEHAFAHHAPPPPPARPPGFHPWFAPAGAHRG